MVLVLPISSKVVAIMVIDCPGHQFSEVEDLDHFKVANVIGPVKNRAWLLLASGISKLFSQLVSDLMT